MFDFEQFFHDSWNGMVAILWGILTTAHLGQNKKIRTKLSKDIYEKDKELLISETNNKLDRLEFHLKLLCKNQGIEYQEKK